MDKKQWTKPIIKHGKLTKYNYIVQYPENLMMGKNFDIGTFVYINAHYGVEIQDNVQICQCLINCVDVYNPTINNRVDAVSIYVARKIAL